MLASWVISEPDPQLPTRVELLLGKSGGNAPHSDQSVSSLCVASSLSHSVHLSN